MTGVIGAGVIGAFILFPRPDPVPPIPPGPDPDHVVNIPVPPGPDPDPVVNIQQVEEAWAEAEQKDTIAAYEAFLSQFPDSPQAVLATERIKKLEADARAAETRAAETRAAEARAAEARAAEARAAEARAAEAQAAEQKKKLEAEREWTAAKDSRSPQAIRDYLINCKLCSHRDEASDLLESLDNAAWLNAEKIGSVYGYTQYMFDFPDGIHAAKANIKSRGGT